MSGTGEHDHAGHDHGGHAHAGHSHAHAGHSHAPTSFGTAFAVAIALNVLIVAGEAIFGIIGHSVALISDAVHNVSDVLGLVAAYAASRLGRQAPSSRFTYGLGGSTILAALFNAVALLVVTGALMLEGVQRLLHPEPVATGIVMMIAGATIIANGLSAWLLSAGQDGDLNIRAAAAHLAADAGVAASVVVGALVIKLTGITLIDPILSLLINAAIIAGTWTILRESITMSLAGVPRSVEQDKVRRYLTGLPGVTALHDLHIWPVSTSSTAMTVHLVIPGGHPGDAFLLDACRVLSEVHKIGHATLQIETDPASACRLVSDLVV